MVRGRRNAIVPNPSNGNAGVNPNTNVSARTLRNRRRRANRAARRRAAVNGGSGNLSNPNTSGNQLALIQDMNAGRMTGDFPDDFGIVRSLRGCLCDMDENTEGWFFKYLDPAGSVESGRATGEFSKIPDGLLTFSVDAEIRIIDTFAVPMIDDGGVPGTIPLDGRTWSMTIFSYPMFRTAYIVVANTFDREISMAVASDLAFVLNNLTDYRATIDQNDWSPFALDIEEGWFFWIKPLPPTYNLPDPVSGDVRTFTSWRMTYKSLTVEHNAPTLIDQGFWNGGHYAIDPTPVTQSVEETEMVSSYIHGHVTASANAFTSPAQLRCLIRIPNLPQIGAVTGGANVVPNSNTFAITTNDDTTSAGSPPSWVVPVNTFWYNPFEVPFAGPGDTVTMTQSNVGVVFSITFTSSLALSVPIVMNFMASANGAIPVGTEGLVQFFVDNAALDVGNRTSNSIEFPAYTPAQIAANNPKMEQFLMKETNGAYIVHKKMRKPVFEVTPAGSFGPVQFTTPGYATSRNSMDGSGILDTIDANFSTASVCVRGIAHANVVVIKGNQGYEAITNLNTPFGQFGHTGLPKNESVLQLVDNLNVRTTGVYPANDNFLGLISRFAAGALKNLLASEATPTILGNLAQNIIRSGLSSANNKLTQVQRRAAVNRLGRSTVRRFQTMNLN